MFPSAKVKDLLQIMSPGGDGVDTAAGAAVPTRSLPRPSASHGSLSGKACLLLQFYHTATATLVLYLAAHIPPFNFCYT